MLSVSFELKNNNYAGVYRLCSTMHVLLCYKSHILWLFIRQIEEQGIDSVRNIEN